MKTVHAMVGRFNPRCVRCGKSAIQIGAAPLVPCQSPQPILPFGPATGVSTDPGVGTGTGTGKSAP